MAEEEIVIIEGDEEEEQEEKKDKKEEEGGKNKKLIILIATIFSLITISIILYFILSADEEAEDMGDFNVSEVSQKLMQRDSSAIRPSELEFMIKKANLLYEKGNKVEALKLFERISSYSEAISNYNLGVAKMKEEDYTSALDSFKKAIKNAENRCVSAINAAVCAYKLGDEIEFEKYINLAHNYLPGESSAPLYSYYYGLIMYYKNLYLEGLSALNHPSSKFYKSDYEHLKSKLYLSLNDNINAINSLEKETTHPDKLSLGLLYARIGEYELAIKYINDYLKSPAEELKANLALGLINLKQGQGSEAGKLFSRVYNKYEENASKVYPIRVKLKDDIFDVNKAQEKFIKELKSNNRRVYDLFFYFAPFKVFNAKQTLYYIKKGNVNIFIDEIEEAKDIFSKSSTLAQVNLTISKAINEVLKYNTREANRLFKSVIDKYPNHSILHYNLALTYAQMGNYKDAYKHFIKSYHLNGRNFLSGIFSIMCGNLIGKDSTRTLRGIQEDLDNSNGKNSEFFSYLASFSTGNIPAAAQWLEDKKEKKSKKPLEILFNLMLSLKVDNSRETLKATEEFKALIPEDVVVNTLDIYGKYQNLAIKDFARRAQDSLNIAKADLEAVYNGPEIARYVYINLLRVTGKLYPFREKLKSIIATKVGDKRGLLQALALANIYMQDFEEAFVTYNTLIDELNEKDSQTIFLASVSAIAANHHPNAIALLELSKLIDPTNLEARYALGLLYQEVENFKGAIIQYSKIEDVNFQSEYFDFDIEG